GNQHQIRSGQTQSGSQRSPGRGGTGGLQSLADRSESRSESRGAFPDSQGPVRSAPRGTSAIRTNDSLDGRRRAWWLWGLRRSGLTRSLIDRDRVTDSVKGIPV